MQQIILDAGMNMDDVWVCITKDWMIYAKDIDFFTKYSELSLQDVHFLSFGLVSFRFGIFCFVFRLAVYRYPPRCYISRFKGQWFC
jgi:hypothetical protein